MKFAFHMAADDNDDTPEFDDSYSDMHEDDENEFVESLEGWTVTPIHFDGWIGCAAHKLQLVVHMGYKELLVFRRVQVAFRKPKSICTLSRQPSHLKYALSARIPIPNETRWNSFLRLHEHILKHFDNINAAINTVNKQSLILLSADKDNLSKVVYVM